MRELLASGDELKAPHQAEAYLRSEPIPADRLVKLRERGRVRIVPLGDLPEELRGSVTTANGAPFEFQPISRDQYQKMLGLCSHGKEFFIIHEGFGFQLGLYVTC